MLYSHFRAHGEGFLNDGHTHSFLRWPGLLAHGSGRGAELSRAACPQSPRHSLPKGVAPTLPHIAPLLPYHLQLREAN